MPDPGYQVEAIPRARAIIADALAVGGGRHIVHALVEMDVTRARRLIREHKQATGEALSFTAFVVAAVARAIGEHKRLHAVRDWRNRLVMFDDVDVATLIEAEIDATAVPHVIRAANRRSMREIHDEIRAVQQRPARSPQRAAWPVRLSSYLPGLVRRLFMRVLRRRPHSLKTLSGTTVVTAVGMFAGGSGWALGILPLHTLGLTLGGIALRPVVEEGCIAMHEVLAVTVSVDHDIVDGAPAARFVRRLRELIEAGEGLPQT